MKDLGGGVSGQNTDPSFFAPTQKDSTAESFSFDRLCFCRVKNALPFKSR